MWQSLVMISVGAVFGAATRWFFSLWLNPLFVGFAFGTLIANLIASFLIGIFTALCWHYPQINEQWKLLITTGFLGSLSTMSSLSAEVVSDILQGKLGLGFGVLGLHIAGCLVATFLGVWFCKLWL